jgi:hypothetical protein
MTMFHAIRTRINATTMVAILALVFAMTGGAYAAKKYLITSTRQISPSVLKALQGKAGPAGPGGAVGAGTPGAQGPAGPQGPAGKDGANGTNGKDGTNGTSGKEGPQGATGAKGAAGVTGAAGTTGPAGSPWTAGGILPSGSTETGSFATTGEIESGLELLKGKNALVAVGFNIPVKPAPAFVYVPGTETGFGSNAGAGCPGVTGEAVPQAASGKFCVYMRGFNAFEQEIPPATVETMNPAGPEFASTGVTPAGTSLLLTCPSGGTLEVCVARGLWAVTG